MNQNVPVEAGENLATRAHARDLAEACVHLDASVIAARSMADHLGESWSVLARQLGLELLDLIDSDDEYRLDDRTLEAMGGAFAEGRLIDAAVGRGWVTIKDRDVFAEAPGYDGILTAIYRACAR